MLKALVWIARPPCLEDPASAGVKVLWTMCLNQVGRDGSFPRCFVCAILTNTQFKQMYISASAIVLLCRILSPPLAQDFDSCLMVDPAQENTSVTTVVREV